MLSTSWMASPRTETPFFLAFANEHCRLIRESFRERFLSMETSQRGKSFGRCCDLLIELSLDGRNRESLPFGTMTSCAVDLSSGPRTDRLYDARAFRESRQHM